MGEADGTAGRADERRPGIRATVAFPGPDPCPIADLSARIDGAVDRLWRSVSADGATPTTTEFVVEATEPPTVAAAEMVMSVGDRHLLRLRHDGGASCPCERLGAHGCAAQRYAARSGTLRLVFNAADFGELQAVVGDLRDRFPDLDVRRLVRSPGSDDRRDEVFVDRGRLTDRQLEVLRTAYGMGYFERPRRANASAVAAELGIDPSTLAEHLAAAQSKLLGDVLEESR